MENRRTHDKNHGSGNLEAVTSNRSVRHERNECPYAEVCLFEHAWERGHLARTKKAGWKPALPDGKLFAREYNYSFAHSILNFLSERE